MLIPWELFIKSFKEKYPKAEINGVLGYEGDHLVHVKPDPQFIEVDPGEDLETPT